MPLLRRETTKTVAETSYEVKETKLSEHQFFKLYMNRLKKQGPAVKDQIPAGSSAPVVPTIIDSMKHSGEIVLIGTVFNKMAKKPAALHAFMDKVPEVEPGPMCYVSEDDTIILEDESSRIELVGDVLKDRKELYTGTVIGVLGTREKEGAREMIKVKSIFFPGLAPQLPMPKLEGDKWVVLLSGLEFGRKCLRLPLQLMMDYLEGYLGDAGETQKIVRVIVAGNLVKQASAIDDIELVGFSNTKEDDRQQTINLGDADTWLSSLCATLDVDLMPGRTDPSNWFLPQQPFHRCLFRLTSSMSSYHGVTNPHRQQLDGVDILGVSGQNVNDMRMYGSTADPLEIMECQLTTRNICPTAPDTLACFPFKASDPFILDKTPHLYFVGNQDSFSTKLVESQGQRVRLVCVPRFHSTQEIAMVNLRTLEVKSMSFKI